MTQPPPVRHDRPGHQAEPGADLRRELQTLDAQLAWLHGRRAHVLQQLAALTGGSPPQPLQPGGPAPARASSESSVQQVLLGSGAVLLGLAGMFFAAVAWALVGPTGRLGILVALALAAGVAAAGLRRRLPGAAGALAGVSASLGATAAYAAPALWGVVWSATAYLTWTAVASAALCATYAALTHLTGLRSWSVGAGLVAVVGTIAAGAAVALETEDVLGYTAATALVFLAAAAAGRVTGPRAEWWLVLAVAGGSSLASVLGWYAETERYVAYAVALLAWAGIVAAGRTIAPVALPATPVTAVAGALAAGAVALVVGSQPWGAPSLPLAGLAVVVAVVVAGVRAVPAAPALTAAAVLGLGAAWVPAVLGDDGSRAGWVAYLVLAAVATAALGASPARAATSYDRAAMWWASGIAASAAWLLHLDGRGVTGPVELYAVPAGVLLLLAGAGWALTTRRTTGAWLPSNAVLLPGLLAILLPGALEAWPVTWDAGLSEPVVRTAVHTVLGAVVAVVGARTRVAALLVAGQALIGVCVLAHLVAVVEQVPLWVALTVAGALLLAVGARWEWLRGRGGAAASWVGRLR